MIKTEQLSKAYGSLQVLKSIDMEVSEGEVVSVIGPSGPGKPPCFRFLEPWGDRIAGG